MMAFKKRSALAALPPETAATQGAVHTAAPTDRDSTQALAQWYYSQVRAASQSRIDNERRLSKFATRFAVGCLAVALVSILGSGALVLLKRPSPLVVIRDNTATGYAEVIDTARGGKITYDEADDRADLKRYVEGRESYDWETIQDLYDLVKLMSANKERARYMAIYDGQSAPQKVLKDQYRVISRVGAITFVGSTAQVFFEKKLVPVGGSMLPRTEYWVATIAYEHGDLPSKTADLILNPHGFRVTSYTVDRDWTRSPNEASSPLPAPSSYGARLASPAVTQPVPAQTIPAPATQTTAPSVPAIQSGGAR